MRSEIVNTDRHWPPLLMCIPKLLLEQQSPLSQTLRLLNGIPKEFFYFFFNHNKLVRLPNIVMLLKLDSSYKTPFYSFCLFTYIYTPLSRPVAPQNHAPTQLCLWVVYSQGPEVQTLCLYAATCCICLHIQCYPVKQNVINLFIYLMVVSLQPTLLFYKLSMCR